MKANDNKEVWIIYYKTSKDPLTCIELTRVAAVRPEKSKAYKEALKMLSQENISSVGYVRNEHAVGMEFKFLNDTKAKAKEFQIISPDGFAIDPTRTYKTNMEGMRAFVQWKERFKRQGYYSSTRGRIPLRDLAYQCTVKYINAN